jgi:hypothetical protein
MRTPIHLVGALRRCLILSLRSHHLILLPTTLYRCVAVVSLGDVDGLLVEWYWSPWGWQGAVPEAWDARGWAGPHSSRSRRVSHLAMGGWRGPGEVCDCHSGRDRLGRAGGGGVRPKTWWTVDLRSARWCCAASTVVSQGGALAITHKRSCRFVVRYMICGTSSRSSE